MKENAAGVYFLLNTRRSRNCFIFKWCTVQEK